MKRQSLLCLLTLLACLWVNAQNIAVKSFQLLENDLTAIFQESQEIDQNGEVAALIKVITTETGFLFDIGALGIVRLVQMPGEIWLYVPRGAQRININHQKLGRLEKPYYFPIPIEAARTYELVLTSKQVKTIVVDVEEVQADSTESSLPKEEIKPLAPQEDKHKEASLFRKTCFYTDAHFLLGAPFAVGASAGIYLGGFNVEGSIDVGLGGKEEVVWYRLVDDIYNPIITTYTPLLLISGCVGYGISVGTCLRLTPQVGTKVLSISGKSSERNQQTYVMSGTASLRAEYALSRRVIFFVAPSYNLPLKRGATAEWLKEDVEAFSRWNKGFSVRVGVSLSF